MTDTPKPLTADEIAAIKYDAANMVTVTSAPVFGAATVRRPIATIEQQCEQIEKVREALMPTFGPGRIVEYDQRRKKMNIPETDFQTICEALAATESQT